MYVLSFMRVKHERNHVKRSSVLMAPGKSAGYGQKSQDDGHNNVTKDPLVFFCILCPPFWFFRWHPADNGAGASLIYSSLKQLYLFQRRMMTADNLTNQCYIGVPHAPKHCFWRTPEALDKVASGFSCIDAAKMVIHKCNDVIMQTPRFCPCNQEISKACTRYMFPNC